VEDLEMNDKEEKEGNKVLGFSKSEWGRRHRKIRELMQLRNLDLLIITGHEGRNGAWLSNLQYSSGMGKRINYVLIPLEGEIVGLTAMPAGGEGIFSNRMVPFKKGKGEARRVRDFATGIAIRIRELGLEKANIGIVDMRVMPAGVYVELLRDLPQAHFLPAGDVLLEARRVKSPEEQEYVRRAGECADKGAEAMIKASAKSGATLKDIRLACRVAMLEAGATNVNFTIISIAPWSEIKSSIMPPSEPDREVQKGDLILNEIEPGYEGYYVQACYPIYVGRTADLPGSFKELFKLHKDIYDMANEEIRPGAKVIDIERKAFQLAASLGDFGRVWTLEAVEVEEDTNKMTYAEIMPGMCFVNHPWIEPPAKMPGHRGHFLGNTVIVTEGKPEVTSRLPVELKAI
jgi:Xaa-Pro aminopeptidase